MDNYDYMLERHAHRKKVARIATLVGAVVIAALIVTSAFVFRAETIEYIGGTQYAPGELNETIFGSDNPNILVYLLFTKKNKQITFVQKYDVDVRWPNKLVVTVYEKPIVGYIGYMGCNMYFDKDGTVVESSSAQYEGVPEIEGLEFKSIVLGSKLDIDNTSIFSDILDLTQAFDKYQLGIDKIYFDSSYDITLYMDDVKIILGSAKDCTDKLFALKQMESSLAGLSGTLYLSDYDEDSTSVIFKND